MKKTVYTLLSILMVALLIGATPAPNLGLSAAIRFYTLGEYHKAVETLLSQSRAKPQAADLKLWLGKSYFRLRRWDESIREFENATQIDPSSGIYHLWLGRAFGRKAEHAPFFLAMGPARRVLKEFETAVRLSPDNIDARFDLLEYCLSAPGILGGGHDRAKKQIEEIERINSRLGYTARSRLYEDEKKYDPARDELFKATVEFPTQAASFVDLADYYFRRMDYANAEPNAKRALELARSPNHKAQLILSASRVRLLKTLPEAEKSLNALSSGPLEDDDPPYEDIFYWLGQARLALGTKEEARQAFESSLRFNPDHSRAKAAMAQLC
jgi:tetratricopeptide (TPR) repeat protein